MASSSKSSSKKNTSSKKNVNVKDLSPKKNPTGGRKTTNPGM